MLHETPQSILSTVIPWSIVSLSFTEEMLLPRKSVLELVNISLSKLPSVHRASVMAAHWCHLQHMD